MVDTGPMTGMPDVFRVPVMIFDLRSHLRFQIGTAEHPGTGGGVVAIRFDYDFRKIVPRTATPAGIAAELNLWDKVTDLQLVDNIEFREDSESSTPVDWARKSDERKLGPITIPRYTPLATQIPNEVLVSLLIMLGRGKIVIDQMDLYLAKAALRKGAHVEMMRTADPEQITIELKEPE